MPQTGSDFGDAGHNQERIEALVRSRISAPRKDESAAIGLC
jgi:hypothetical protein